MAEEALSLITVGRAVADGWCAFVRGAVHGEAITLPFASLGMAGEAFVAMNEACVFGPEGAGEAVRHFAGRLRERGLPGMITVLSTAAEEAAPAAAELGLGDGGVASLMYVHATQARRIEHDFTVERVVDIYGVKEAAGVLNDAYDLPLDWCEGMLGPTFPSLQPADAFLARHHGRALAVVCTGRVGAAVGIYAVGTRQAHRHRGAASAALSAAVDHHLRTGAHVFTLTTEPATEPLYAALGFAPVDHPQVWLVEVR